MRIPLPPFTEKPNAAAHSYPFRIAFQTHQFLQASAFHVALLDIAAGERVRQPNAIDEIRQACLSGGLDAATWDLGWDILANYKDVFASSVFQTVVTSLRSHWDWYVRRLAEFVSFGRRHVASPPLTPKNEKALLGIGFREFADQIRILEAATGLALMPTTAIIDAITLMTHIRNLGLHNRWEIDQRFVDSHPDCGLEVGELRLVDASELENWGAALREVVTKTAIEVAKLFASAPTYP